MYPKNRKAETLTGKVKNGVAEEPHTANQQTEMAENTLLPTHWKMLTQCKDNEQTRSDLESSKWPLKRENKRAPSPRRDKNHSQRKRKKQYNSYTPRSSKCFFLFLLGLSSANPRVVLNFRTQHRSKGRLLRPKSGPPSK